MTKKRMIKKPSNKKKNKQGNQEIVDTNNITLSFFDKESDVDPDGYRCTMYTYNNYKIATMQLEDDSGFEHKLDIRLVLEKDFDCVPVKVLTLDDAISIINIMNKVNI